MKYVAVLCFLSNDKKKGSFLVRIFSKSDGYLGDFSVILVNTGCRSESPEMVFCDGYVPEEYSISKEEMKQACIDALAAYKTETNLQW